MKCIKNLETKVIKRISDTVARNKVRSKKFMFCSKSEWKEKVRDINKNK